MISRKQFQKMNAARWEESESQIQRLDGKGPLTPEEARALPSNFRKVCQDLGLAGERLYGMALSSRLNGLVMGGFRHLHRSRARLQPIRFLTRTFPGAFKHNLGFFGSAWCSFGCLSFSWPSRGSGDWHGFSLC